MDLPVDPAPLRDRARTRDRILAAADDLLTSASARDLKVRDIAERAGVSASLVVQYFVSKDALVLDIGLRRLGAPPTPPPVAEGLAAVVGWMTAFDHAHADLLSEVMRQTWRFDPRQEATLTRAFAPRCDAIRSAAPDLTAAQSDVLLHLYFQAIRKSFAKNLKFEDLTRVAIEHVVTGKNIISS